MNVKRICVAHDCATSSVLDATKAKITHTLTQCMRVDLFRSKYVWRCIIDAAKVVFLQRSMHYHGAAMFRIMLNQRL